MTTLLDRYLPHCDFMEHHETLVRATPERVYAALRTADLSSFVSRALMFLRSGGYKRIATLDSLTRDFFSLLEDDPPREVVLGLEGPFWQPACKTSQPSRDAYGGSARPGSALVAWNFLITPDGARTRLSTETRILCGDDASRRKFGLYWLLVRPGSGLIRRMMLRAVRRAAERA